MCDPREWTWIAGRPERAETGMILEYDGGYRLLVGTIDTARPGALSLHAVTRWTTLPSSVLRLLEPRGGRGRP